ERAGRCAQGEFRTERAPDARGPRAYLRRRPDPAPDQRKCQIRVTRRSRGSGTRKSTGPHRRVSSGKERRSHARPEMSLGARRTGLRDMRRSFLLLPPAAAAAVAAPAKAGIGNPDVAALQVALAAKGIYAGPVDGMLGPATETAVRRL